MKYLIALLFLAMSAGCATTKQAVPVASFNNLKSGNALIVVHRRNETMGKARNVEVIDGDTLIGHVSGGKSLIWQRPAGEVLLSLAAASQLVNEWQNVSDVVKAGKKHEYLVYWSDAKMSMTISRLK